MSEITKHLESTGQLEKVYKALDNDEYAAWLEPVISYAQSVNESAMAHIACLINDYCNSSGLFQ